MKKLCVGLAVLPFLISAACVGAEKSSTPLSPVIAGPMPGVGITAPTVVAPGVDAMIDTNAQPITLQVGNAETNGVRPLRYRFEVATDSGFANLVFAKEGIPQDASGRTNMTLPGPLAPERKYFWHARAEDGANTGSFGATSAFNVFTPVVIGAPTAISPINDATTGSQPRFVVGSPALTGPVGPLAYYLEIASSASFAQIVAAYAFPQTGNPTELTAPGALAAGQYFWHVRAYDGGHSGPFSAAQSFRTSGGGGGGGGGGGIFNPNGPWQSCGSTPGEAIVQCVYAAITPGHTVESVFEMTKRVAWLLRGSGFGLLRKDGGENIVSWNGTSFAAARIVTTNGHLYKLLGDVPNGGPQWVDEGVDPGLIPLWIAPMQP
jgi:hypothetical protein